MDTNARRLLVAATEADKQQAKIQEQVQTLAMALGAIPPFELVELRGNVRREFVDNNTGIRFTIAGVNSARAYLVSLPVEWLRSVIAELDVAIAAAEAAQPETPASEAAA